MGESNLTMSKSRNGFGGLQVSVLNDHDLYAYAAVQVKYMDWSMYFRVGNEDFLYNVP
jgi:hypothetical protein